MDKVKHKNEREKKEREREEANSFLERTVFAAVQESIHIECLSSERMVNSIQQACDVI